MQMNLEALFAYFFGPFPHSGNLASLTLALACMAYIFDSLWLTIKTTHITKTLYGQQYIF